MRYRVNFYTLSDCHAEKIIESADRASLDAQLTNQMIDRSAPFTIYEIGDNKPMTVPLTPAPTTPAEQFREEIRNSFDLLHVENGEIRAEIETLRSALTTIAHGLAHAATATATTPGAYSEMVIESVIMTTDDKGKPVYKATGAPYSKFGVRIWNEVLPALGINPLSLKPGPNPINPAIPARVLMQTNEETGKPAPRKITGKA